MRELRLHGRRDGPLAGHPFDGVVAPWLHDRAIVLEVYGGEEGVAKLTRASRDAQKTFERTGQAVMAPAASMTDKSAIMFKAPYYTEKHRGLIPEWVNRFNLSTWEPWLTYDAVAIAPRLGGKPVLLVHSEAAAIPAGARRFLCGSDRAQVGALARQGEPT